MQIDNAWMPFEIYRRTALFLQHIQSDRDIRYPETRLRLALEMRAQIDEADFPLFQDVIERFQKAKKKISILDWPLLMEWTERKEMGLCLAKIHHLAQNDAPRSRESQACLNRLREIAELFRKTVPIFDPPFFELVAHRWTSAALRDEAYYLLGRLDALRLAAVA